MGIRVTTALDLVAGHDNSTENKIFGGQGVLSEILDTLEHGESGTYLIAAGEAQVIDKGDIADIRYVYLEGDGEFSVAFTAAAASAASIAGVGGTYPTSFAGGEALNLLIDAVPVSVVFDVADQTRDQVIARINFVAALAGFVAQPVAFPVTTQLTLRSPTTGLASTVEVLASSDAGALTALGLAVSTSTGAAAEPGTTDVQVSRPADPAGASAADGVKSYLLATIEATAIQVTNTQAATALNLKVFLGGDLTSTP